MYRIKKIVLKKILSVFLISLILLTHPVKISSLNQSEIQNPDVFISETASIAPDPLDPATNYETQGGGYIQLMYEGLYQYGNDSLTQLKPSLATSYTLSPDGLIYTFTLRTGVTFALQPNQSIGQPFNAYVMQYSIDRAIIMNDHSGPAWMIQDWIKGAAVIEHTKDNNQTQANTFLAQKSVWATDATHLAITLDAPFGGFIQAILFPVAFAISPKAIIDNKPFDYTTQQDDVFGMVSLASMFPGIANATILSNLGLPSNYNIDNSGVVPQSDHTGPAAYTWLQSHSAGTGPYYLVDMVQGNNADLIKNNNWWDKNEFQLNSPDKIKIIQVPEDATRVLDLKQGTTDAGGIPSNHFVDFGVSSSHPTSNFTGVNAYVYDTITNYFIGMNMNDTLPTGQVNQNSSSMYSGSAYGGNTAGNNYSSLLKFSWKDANNHTQYASPANPFSSLLFREAFAYTFPTQTYIDQAFAGFAIRMQGAIPKGLLGYNDQLIANGNIPTQNLTTAKALFNQVGWKGDIHFTYIAGSTSRGIAANLLAIAMNSMNVGINIVVDQITWGPIIFGFNNEQAMFQSAWTPDFADPHDYAVPYYQGGYLFASLINYDNPHIDYLIAAAAATFDPVQRTNLYHEMEVNATGDYPYIYLVQTQNVLFLRDWINGVNNSNSDALNPMVNFLPLQFLAKGEYGLYSTFTSSISQTLSSNSQVLSIYQLVLDGLTIISIVGIPILGLFTIYAFRRKFNIIRRINENQRLANKGKNHPQYDNSLLSSETFSKLEEIIHENEPETK